MIEGLHFFNSSSHGIFQMPVLEKTHKIASTPMTKADSCQRCQLPTLKHSLCQLTRLYTAYPMEVFYF